jgi:hypothetical protein
VAISREQLWSILKDLPESQRRSAAKRIVYADECGWVGIGIWVWNCCRRHEADLVGICPAGTLEFLHWEGTTNEE